MSEDTIESLRARVQQLEAELAAAKQDVERASAREQAEPDEDREWGEFNPG